MIARLRREEGSALVTAIILITVMLMLGLGVHAMADTQEKQAGQEQVREAAFTLSEGALSAQIFQLARSFPFTAAQAFPASCAPGAPATQPCPDTSSMASAYSGGNYTAMCNGAPVTPWQTTVHDNGNGSEQFYSAAVVNAQPTYDANRDGAVWARADGWSGCRRRAIVTLVKATDQTIPFPRNVITANWFQTTNQGKKVIVDTQGKFAMPPQVRPRPNDQSAQPADLSVRCTGMTPAACLSFNAAKDQVSPNTAAVGPSPDPLLSADQLESIRRKARSLNTYYVAGTCPPSLNGATVYAEDLSGCGPYPGGNTANTPGMLIADRGTLSLGGNSIFYGVVYMRNLQGSTGAVVTISGTAGIQGSVAVDGRGGVSAGSSKTNIVFDPRSASLVTGLASAASVPNSWRELAAGQ